jgi:hypothetical protein
MKATPRPPSGVSPAHRKLWRELVDDYGIEDRGGLEILRSGLRSLAQAEAGEAIVAQDGRCRWTDSGRSGRTRCWQWRVTSGRSGSRRSS